jgi:hypothetical protein
MTGNQVALFEGAQLPEHLVDIGLEDNVVGRDQIPQLSFRGKVWRGIIDGIETIVPAADGEPATSVQVVILDYNKKRSRAYYEGAYVEGQNKAPVCWSKDGEVPDESVQQKQHPTCAGCPQSVKGSRVTDSNKAVAACGQYKRAVVVPEQDVSFEPLLIKIPQTSMWDKDNKENEAKGWFAFDQYMDMLKARGVMHTAKVITRIKFDSRMAYPKLLFKAVDYTPAEAVPKIKAQLAKKEKIEALLNTMPDMAGGERETAPTPEGFVEPAQQATAAPAATAAAATPVGAAAPAAPRAPRGRPAKAPAAAPQTAQAPQPVVTQADDDDRPAAGFGPTTAPSIPVSTAKPATSKGLENLLAGWATPKE